jgi:hypothetical protein
MAKKSKPKFESSVYQDEHGNYFLRRSDRTEDEPLSELEVRRHLQAFVERMQIQNAVDDLAALLASMGVKLPDEVRQQVIENTHKKLREAGLTRTGSLPDLSKYLPND